MGPVGGADLHQLSSGGLDELGQAEPCADLDQLTATDDHAARADQGSGRQGKRRGPVVDDEGILCRAAGVQQRAASTCSSLGPAARAQVHLDVDVAGGVDDGLASRRGQRCPSEIGVDHHTGGVDDRTQGRRAMSLQLGDHLGHDLLGGDDSAASAALGLVDDPLEHRLAE